MTKVIWNRSRPDSVPHPPSSAASAASAPALVPWAIFLAILAVYLLFPTRNYYWDGIFFARVIETVAGFHPSLFHPNHLLYNVVGYFLFKAARIAGLQLRAIEVLQLANSVVSVLTAYLIYQILRRSLRSDYLVWCLTLAFAFSSTWWKFSTDANAYIFSVFCLLLAYNFTLRSFKPRPVLVAVIFSSAALLHQLAVIAYPIMALALYWQATAIRQKRRWWIVSQFCVLSFVLAFSAYCYCFYFVTGTLSPGRFVQWVTSYSPDASFSFDALSNLGYTLRGNVRLFFSARLSLLRGLLSPAIVTVIVLFIIVVLLWFASLVKATRARDLVLKNISSRVFADRTTALYLLWIWLYVAFLFFWLPQNTFYRLFYLPAIILFFGELPAGRNGDNKKPTYRLGLFVAVMTLSNFLFFIYPGAHAEKNPPLSLALEMNKVWQPGTIVYFHSENSDNNLVAYFNPGIEWRPLRSIGEMDAELKQVQAAGKTAWLDASAIDQLSSKPEGNDWLARHGRRETWHERQAFNVKFIQVGP